MNKSGWDDIRYVLAVAETGSLNAAANQLGVTHATVLRRVSIFEQRHGQAVFQKLATGYRVLPEAEQVLAAARNVRDAVLAVDRAFLGADTALSGSVRIASTDSICTRLLPGIVETISVKHPGLEIVLLSGNTRHDFLRLSADITVRPAMALDDDMSGEQAGHFDFAAYSVADARDLWLGLEGPLKQIPVGKWLQQSIGQKRIGAGADSFLVLRELAAAGAGRGILPTFLGDGDRRVSRLSDAIPHFRTPIWVATLKELANNARFRTVRDILCAELETLLEPWSEPDPQRR